MFIKDGESYTDRVVLENLVKHTRGGVYGNPSRNPSGYISSNCY